MANKALFSVVVFPGLAEIAVRLARLGWTFIATLDAAKELRMAGLDVTDVAVFNGVSEIFPFPPTLHPRMEKALTTDSEDRIDLVFDIPYSLETGNDVGGRTLLALAVKGSRIAASSIEDMENIVASLEAMGSISRELLASLNAKACAEIAHHYRTLAELYQPGQRLAMEFIRQRPLANGENPYQIPAWLGDAETGDTLGLPKFKQLAGDPPCFTNLADLDAILSAITRTDMAFRTNFDKAPFIVITAKHGNPCGIGVDWKDKGQAINRALWGSPLAIWGGEVICNFRIDDEIARQLHSSALRNEKLGNPYWMLHVIAAPEWTEEAVAILSKNKDRKLLCNPALNQPTLSMETHIRPVRGGALIEPPANYILDFSKIDWGSGPIRDQSVIADLVVAWAASFSSSLGGNEVILVKDGRLIGAGGGPSTVDACRAAVAAAEINGHATAGSSFGADAFFPALDAPQLLVKAGVRYGLVPGGGKQENTVRQYFRENQISVGYLPQEIRGFCRH